MSKISENGLFGQKKAPAGWFHSKTKVVNTFLTIPDRIWTEIYLFFIYVFDENLGFSIEIAKTMKLLRKLSYGTTREQTYSRTSQIATTYTNSLQHDLVG